MRCNIRELTDKQKKKKIALTRRKTRERVSEFRKLKKETGVRSIQFYIDESDKAVLDDYKVKKGLTTSEVFKELIRSILERRLKVLD